MRITIEHDSGEIRRFDANLPVDPNALIVIETVDPASGHEVFSVKQRELTEWDVASDKLKTRIVEQFQSVNVVPPLNKQ